MTAKDIAAIFERALALQFGYRVRKNRKKAFELFHQTAAAGHSGAMYSVAKCHHEGIGVDQNEALAAEWLNKAEHAGDWNALYVRGNQLPSNRSKRAGFTRLLKADEAGHSLAQVKVAWCYSNGIGVRRSRESAATWYHNAADLGDPDGQYNYAWCLQTGYGIAPDVTSAIGSYRRAAQSGHLAAMANLSYLYARGLGVRRDPQESNRALWSGRARSRSGRDVHWAVLLMDSGTATKSQLRRARTLLDKIN